MHIYILPNRIMLANFERDGFMTVNGNQGSRPNYMSTLEKIKLSPLPYIQDTHQQWTVSLVCVIVEGAGLNILTGRSCPFIVSSHSHRF